MATHFLYLTNSRLVSLLARRGQIAARREFAVSGAGIAEFERYLATMAKVTTRIFTDLAEEDLRVDTIPHVGRGDREAIFNRKLGQIYRNTPYRYALLQGREAEERRDDRVAYVAITNGEVLKPWLEVLERRKIPLAGIHSAAVLGAGLVEELDLRFPHTLLVLFTPGEVVRQTYFRGGEIQFTRLSPIDLEEGRTLGTFLAEETSRTWQYLDNVRSFGPEDRLQVCVVAHPRDHPVIKPALSDFPQVEFRLIDIEQAAAKLGLKPAPLGSSADELLVQLFLIHPAANHFASSELRRYATLLTARKALNAASLGVLAASLAVGGWNLARIFQSTEADQRISQEISAFNREFDQITRSLPAFGVGGTTMREAATFYTSFIREFPTVSGFLVPLSETLEGHPQVRLTQLAWQATDDPKAMPPITSIPPRVPPPVKALAKGGDAVARAAPDDANAPFAGGRYEVALLEATVSVPSHDFRGALAEVERLAADIGGMKGYRAEIIESPLDLRPSLSLQGRHAEREPGLMEPRFILRIVRSHEASA